MSVTLVSYSVHVHRYLPGFLMTLLILLTALPCTLLEHATAIPITITSTKEIVHDHTTCVLSITIPAKGKYNQSTQKQKS